RCCDFCFFFFFSSSRRHTRFSRDWSSDVCSSDLCPVGEQCIDAGTTTGHGAVDAFFGQQQRALDAIVDKGLQQRFAQRLVIRQGDEFIQRRDNDLVGHEQSSQ